MMKFDILTLFPEMFPPVLETSILGRAAKKKLLSFSYTNIRDYSKDKHKKVDDYPYGGGCGMIMQPQPILDAYNAITKDTHKKPLTIFLSPRGKVFNQEIAKEMAEFDHIVLICGHYEGIDQRIIEEIGDFELSIGDFVLTGGELGAMIVCDAVARLVPGVLSEESSYTGESHFNGLLEYPQYTRPPVFNNIPVPDVLLSGHAENIKKWRIEQSLNLTEGVRPDLFKKQAQLPFCVRHANDTKIPFVFCAYGNENTKEILYKTRRNIISKLQKKGFYPKEYKSVLTNVRALSDLIRNAEIPVVILTLEDEPLSTMTFSSPVCIIGHHEDVNSIYPYKLDQDKHKEDLNTQILHFLSIIHTIEKYGKQYKK